MSSLLDILGYIGSSLDKPGRAVRGFLGGRPEEALAAIPFSDAMGLTNESNAISGRNLLEKIGAVTGKSPDGGFDWGDVAGMGTEMALDPINFMGPGLIKRALSARKAAMASNATREALLAKGAMPAEVAALTKAVGAEGKPLKMFHGTNKAFDKFDIAKADPGGLVGPGAYFTDNPHIASEYATSWKEGAPNVRAHFVDVRKPFAADQDLIPEELVNELSAQAQGVRFRHPDNIDYEKMAEFMYGTGQRPKARLNDALRSRGFDAIGYEGGNVVGDVKHQVYNVLDPSNIYAPMVAPGLRREPSVSPLLASLAGYNTGRGMRGYP